MDNVELLTKLKKRIKYDIDVFPTIDDYNTILDCLIEDSKHIALSLYAPYEEEIISLPTKYDNWLIRCAVEIYNNIGTIGLRSYAENGISWTRDSGYISKDLREEIEPMIGVIKEESVNNV